jgi:hypothetical protein
MMMKREGKERIPWGQGGNKVKRRTRVETRRNRDARKSVKGFKKSKKGKKSKKSPKESKTESPQQKIYYPEGYISVTACHP